MEKKLKLEPEELIIEGGTCLGSFDRKREYGNLGFVKRNKICVCCRQVTWESTVIMPGCPCCNKKMTLEPYHPNALRNRLPVEFKGSAIPGKRFCHPRNQHTYE